jgi:hypothetical protein
MSGSPAARTIVLALLLAARAVSATAQEPAPPVIPGPKPKLQPDDKRRTMRSYGHNLAYNLRDVLAPRNFKPLLITAAATAPSFLLDDEGERYFRDHPHENWGRLGANAGGTLAMAGLTIGVFSAGRISRGDRFRSMSYDLSQAILVTQVYTQGLKFAVGRERPDGSNNKSFPSGHSSNAYTAATVAALHYKKMAIPAYGLATYIGVSRMAANKHHFSDVVAGAGLGWVIGRSVVHRNSRPPDPKPGDPVPAVPPKATWQVTGWPGPSGDGRGAVLVVRF